MAIIHDAESYNHFWKTINNVCDQEWSLIASQCDRVAVKIPKPDFEIKASEVTLGEGAVGHQIKTIWVDPSKTNEKVFDQAD